MSWEQVKLGDNVIISKGKKHGAVPTGKNNYINIETLHNPFNSLYTNEIGNVVKENDIVIAWDGANSGKVGVGLKGVIGSTLAKLHLKNENIDPKYFYWFLESQNGVIKSQRTGATIPHVNGAALKEMGVPLPPLPIQKRIAEILDAADALRKKDQELLKKYDELAQAIFIDMFGDPVRNENRWDELLIGDSIKFITSGSRGWARYYDKRGDLFLRINNVGYDKMKLEDLVYVNAPSNAESKRTEVKEGDILVSITADLGRTCVIPPNFPKAFINQHLAILRMKEEIIPEFVSYVLSTEYGRLQFNKLNKGGVKAGLNFDDIKSLRFLTPPLEMQKKFISALCSVRQQAKLIKSQHVMSNSLCDSLMQKAFKVELVN